MKNTWRMNIFVPLTGGLGNQLFQYSFALSLSEKTGLSLLLDDKVAKPRTVSGRATICQLEICGREIQTLNDRPRLRTILTKMYSWNLVNGAQHRLRNLNQLSKISNLASRLVILLSKRIWVKLHISSGLGFDSNIAKISSGGFFIGYFQTYRFAQNPSVFAQLMTLQPKKKSQSCLQTLERIAKEKPILVHVRLTDYVFENSFGIPSEKYYLDALDYLRSVGMDNPIWIFSDDILAARRHLSNLNKIYDLHFVEMNGISDVENWYLMRFFAGYVIANSSYSWWSAFLRQTQSSPVIYPLPWFSDGETPRDLFPVDWLPIPTQGK